MRLPDTASRAWLYVPILLLATIMVRAPRAAGQELPPRLTPEARTRLAEAAQDATLPPWQRAFMLEMTRGETARVTADRSAVLPSSALPSPGVTADDGDWSEVRPPSARVLQTAIYDPIRDRMVVFGGNDGGNRNDVWMLSLAGSPTWSAVTPAGIAPSPRSAHAAIYDPVRDRMVVFGGSDSDSLRNDVWALSLAGTPSWSALVAEGDAPPARRAHTAVYDRLRDRMVVFGGSALDSIRDDVWELSLAGTPAWSDLAPAGIPPSPRYEHTAIYDPVRDRMVVFGGSDSVGFRNDVWALSLAGSPAWSAVIPAGSAPSARSGHTALYDPVRDRMVVFGGNDGDSLRNDVSALSLTGTTAWSALAPAGNPPSGRHRHAAIYDPVRDRMVVFAGTDASLRNDGWALSLAGSPAWSVAAATGAPPSARSFHTAIYDPVRDQMVVFGGYDASVPHFRNDVWILSLAGSPAWSALVPSGTPPSARIWHTAFYDSARDRMVVFGGYDGTYRNDVWALSLAASPAWSALAPTGTAPSARYSATAFYDPVRDRMVVFGGNDGMSLRDDVWALSLAGSPAWSALTPVGTPPTARYQHTALYDPVRDRMVVFGGYDGGGPRNDLWTLSLSGTPTWSELALPGSTPSARYQHTASYDPVRDRMVVFGGNDDNILRNDVWALSLAGTPAWTALAPGGPSPPGRSDHSAIYDPVRHRIVIFGGYRGGYRNDAWALVWGTTVSVPVEPLPRGFELAPVWPNPSSDATFMDLALSAPARVVLNVFDAQGRRVKRLADEWLGAGHHGASWLGSDDSGHQVGSGVYYIRMQVGGSQVTRRVVRIR